MLGGTFYLDYSKSLLCFMFDDDDPLFVYADCKIVYGCHFCQSKMIFNNGEKLDTHIKRQARLPPRLLGDADT
jgi:hypothetical protein